MTASLAEALSRLADLSVPADAAPPVDAESKARWTAERREELWEAGMALLRDGRVGVMMTAGGLSTRWDGAGPRGDCVMTHDGRTLLQLHGEAMGRLSARAGREVPWVVLTSERVRGDVVAAFERAGLFGRTSVEFINQPSLPAIDAAGRLASPLDGSPTVFPTGHGGAVAAFAVSDCLRRWVELGVKLVFHFQYPNALEIIADPEMLGLHERLGAEASVKGFAYERAGKLGRIVSAGRTHRIVEYHAVADKKEPKWWTRAPANQGTYVWSTSLLSRSVQSPIAFYRIPHGDARTPGVFKLEQFAFDLLPAARRTAVLLVDREQEFAIVRDEASAEAARSALSRIIPR